MIDVVAVMHPLKLVIDNYPEGQTEELDVPNNKENEELGMRQVPFSRELYIETQHDFMDSSLLRSIRDSILVMRFVS